MTDSDQIRTAEIIAVGSELLGSTRLDTNSLFVAERLASLGIDLRAKAVVGDNRSALAGLVRQALERVDVVILSGGLGPTDDDVTRDAVADV
jgi:nicotinamide-nucleotide amidase